MAQYFNPDPQLAHRSRSFELEFQGESFRFCTDSGTFSRSRLDFGTELMLTAALGDPDFPRRGKVLDLACGWGPVGCVLLRFFPELSLAMSDVNARALAAARENLKINAAAARPNSTGTAGGSSESEFGAAWSRETDLLAERRAEADDKVPAAKVQLRQADGTAGWDEDFDAILLNPPIRAGKAVVYRLFAEAAEALVPGGQFYTVIRRQQGANSARRELERLFGETAVSDLARRAGYHVFLCRKA